MKAVELKNKSQDELNKLLLDLRKQQMNLRFQKAGGQLANPGQARTLRRDIARIKTQLTASAAASAAPAKAKTATKTPAKKAK
jgi:large subunit ribosomal protein L29